MAAIVLVLFGTYSAWFFYENAYPKCDHCKERHLWRQLHRNASDIVGMGSGLCQSCAVADEFWRVSCQR